MKARRDGTIIVNVVGGVADMSAFEDVFADGYSPQAWAQFFARMPDAKVREDERDLVLALAELGYRITYSTMFSAITSADTAGWLAAHEFPAGDLRCRKVDDRSPAVLIKRQHCEAVRREIEPDTPLVFVDDQAHVIKYLRAGGILAFAFDELLDLRLGDLRRTLAAPPPKPVAKPRRGPALTVAGGLVDALREAAAALGDADGWANLSTVCNAITKRHARVDVSQQGYHSLGKFVLGCGAFEVDHRDAGPGRTPTPYVRPAPVHG
ncbi:OST-HTH/LOTUS domain-containing protein [Nocardia yamanashiensis]|uniref:OST-HTH/LOTUS domain-containing protein n=1 Tax=Nocardia yamanashiensis TaxID=209247 RepID=UPI000833D664|nr:OST-HTH/LOTUS domain-containing protein [Nocardia yamanashiensis]